MPKLRFALPGVAALAFGILTATAAFAQQPDRGRDTQASPAQERAAPSSPDDDDDDRVERGQRGDRDWDGRDDRRDRRWSERERRDLDDRDDEDRWRRGRRWQDDRPMMRRGDRGDRDWRHGGEHRMGSHRHGGPTMMRALRRLCGPRSERIMAFMLNRLERTTQPTDAQRPAFDRLKDAAAQAHGTIKAACPTGALPLTPPGRLAAVEKGLEALLAAVRTVRGPLEEFYGSLSEEQKARLYMAHRRHWDHGDHWRDGDRDRDRDWRRRERDDDRGDTRERRREGSRDRGDRDRDRDRDRDGWLDDWRGRS